MRVQLPHACCMHDDPRMASYPLKLQNLYPYCLLILSVFSIVRAAYTLVVSYRIRSKMSNENPVICNYFVYRVLYNV